MKDRNLFKKGEKRAQSSGKKGGLKTKEIIGLRGYSENGKKGADARWGNKVPTVVLNDSKVNTPVV